MEKEEKKEEKKEFIKVEISAKVFNPETGEVIEDKGWTKANSLIRQFIDILAVQASGLNWNVKRTDDVILSLAPNAGAFAANAGNSNDIYGIVIGTGIAPVTISDNNLGTKIPNTTANHGIVTFAAEYPSASQSRAVISRVFTNNSGSQLNITEVGLYVSLTAGQACIERTLYSVSVPNLMSVIISYRFSVYL